MSSMLRRNSCAWKRPSPDHNVKTCKGFSKNNVTRLHLCGTDYIPTASDFTCRCWLSSENQFKHASTCSRLNDTSVVVLAYCYVPYIIYRYELAAAQASAMSLSMSLGSDVAGHLQSSLSPDYNPFSQALDLDIPQDQESKMDSYDCGMDEVSSGMIMDDFIPKHLHGLTGIRDDEQDTELQNVKRLVAPPPPPRTRTPPSTPSGSPPSDNIFPDPLKKTPPGAVETGYERKDLSPAPFMHTPAASNPAVGAPTINIGTSPCRTSVPAMDSAQGEWEVRRAPYSLECEVQYVKYFFTLFAHTSKKFALTCYDWPFLRKCIFSMGAHRA
jgi:hypothetical protein